jgi:hypothetical protein
VILATITLLPAWKAGRKADGTSRALIGLLASATTAESQIVKGLVE